MDTTAQTQTQTAADNRQGPDWTELMRRYRLRNIVDADDGSYEVESASGQTYRVRTRTRLTRRGSMYFTQECNCPARKRCRHIDAVCAMRYAEAIVAHDYDMLEMIERES